ncbi:MAG: trigger factor [Chloroflexota bacterium]|nr:trigger factor [Chloroflexota bacterium]
MKSTAEKIEGSLVVLNVEVDAEEMENAVKGAYRRVGAKTAIPGFRKGKAPIAILEQFVGREALVQDAAEHLMAKVYDEALIEQDVDAIAQPEIEIIQMEPLSFKATVPVRPTVELGDYHQIKLTPEPVEISDDDVTEVLDRIRDIHASWEPVERAAQSGDLLSIDVEGTVGEEVIINEKSGWYQLSPEASQALPGFAEQVEGASKGEERAFTLTLPERFGDAGGGECDFKVTVNEVKQKSLPELDDELVKSLGQGMETVDALKEKVAGDLRARKEWEAKGALEEQAIKELVDLTQAEFPEVMVEHELEHLIEERERSFSGHKGLEEYLESVDKTEEDLRNELRPMAERILMRSLALQRFAELEGIEVSAADISHEIEHMMQHTEDEGTRQLFSTPEARESIGRNLFIKKAIDRLVAVATADEESAELQVKDEEDESEHTTT